MKTYYLTLSQMFPKGHPREGQPTLFKDKLFNGLDNERDDGKIHTIRGNYEFWKKRFEQIERGEACLSIREWVGKPYGKGSTQREIIRLTKEDGIGIQKLEIVRAKYNSRQIWLGYTDGLQEPPMFFEVLAEKDGLSFEDWIAWFEGYDLNKPLAIIHFTKFRY